MSIQVLSLAAAAMGDRNYNHHTGTIGGLAGSSNHNSPLLNAIAARNASGLAQLRALNVHSLSLASNGSRMARSPSISSSTSTAATATSNSHNNKNVAAGGLLTGVGQESPSQQQRVNSSRISGIVSHHLRAHRTQQLQQQHQLQQEQRLDLESLLRAKAVADATDNQLLALRRAYEYGLGSGRSNNSSLFAATAADVHASRSSSSSARLAMAAAAMLDPRLLQLSAAANMNMNLNMAAAAAALAARNSNNIPLAPNSPADQGSLPSKSSTKMLQSPNSSTSSTAPSSTTTTTTRRASLFMDCDEDSLSEYQCLIRQQMELFEATREEAASSVQGRNKQILVGQVGIRCRYCSSCTSNTSTSTSSSPAKKGPSGSTNGAPKASLYFPTKLERIYQAAQNLASFHLCGNCPLVPPEIKQRILVLRERKSPAGGGKRYWAEGVRCLGVIEHQGGLFFASSKKK